MRAVFALVVSCGLVLLGAWPAAASIPSAGICQGAFDIMTSIAANPVGAGFWRQVDALDRSNPLSGTTSSSGPVPSFEPLQDSGASITATPSGQGYYIVDPETGAIYSRGDAQTLAALPQQKDSNTEWGPFQPGNCTINGINTYDAITAVTTTPNGGLIATDRQGHLYAVGGASNPDPKFQIGDAVTPVALVPTSSGNGLWMLASNPEAVISHKTTILYAFGDALCYTSAGSSSSAPIDGKCATPGLGGAAGTSLVVTPDQNGYWIGADTGTVQNFGAAVDYGSPPQVDPDYFRDNAYSSGTTISNGNLSGYAIIRADGTVYAFGPSSFATGGSANALTGAATTVQLGGWDFGGGAMIFQIASQPGGGTLSNLNTATGSLTYTSDSTFEGTDTFTYQVAPASNPTLWSAPATATVNVSATNWPSVVVPADGTTHEVTVPQGVTGMQFTAAGGSGGYTNAPYDSGHGGHGAQAEGVFPVQAGQVFTVAAGGSGGGAGSDCNAGGAGGSSGSGFTGGAGGAANTDNCTGSGTGAGGGAASTIQAPDGSWVTVAAGGGGGGGLARDSYEVGNGGYAGETADNGSGAHDPFGGGAGGAGKGGAGAAMIGGAGVSAPGGSGGGGGGGGGVNGGTGGGHGGDHNWSGGGGGGGAGSSMLAAAVTDGAITSAAQAGDGAVAITWQGSEVAPVLTSDDPPLTTQAGSAYAGYTFTVAAATYPDPVFSLASGTLPAGLTLDEGGTLSGTPTVAGTYTFAVQAMNHAGSATGASHELVVSPAPAAPTFTADDPPPTGNVASGWTYQFAASGYPAPTFSLLSGQLPDGLSLDPVSGVVSGVPTTTGTSTFQIGASNGVNPDASSAPHSLTIDPALTAPQFTSVTPPSTAFAGTEYEYQFVASGYPTPQYYVTDGALPDGLSLDSSTGGLGGTPTEQGTFTFQVTADNAVDPSADSPDLTITVGPPASPAVFTADDPPADANQGSQYSYQFAATGNPAPTFTVSPGSLPTGLALDPATGIVAGTPTALGTFTFAITAANFLGPVQGEKHTITVGPPLAPPTFTADEPPVTGNVDSPYQYQFAATGNPAPAFTLGSGSLPDGLTLDPVSGVLQGSPSTTGTFAFQIAASNGVDPDAVTGELTIDIAPRLVAPSFTADFPPTTANVGSGYSYVFAATGYPAPTFTVTSGALPAGLTLDSTTGAIEGSPASTGVSTFQITAGNGVDPAATSAEHTITVAPRLVAPAFTADSPSGSANVGSDYSYQFEASGYPSPTFTVSSGALPPGLSVDGTTGLLTGVPTAVGTYSFQITAANGVEPDSVSAGHTVAVDPRLVAPAFTQDSPPASGNVGSGYAYQLAASGYPAPTFSLSRGALPDGVTLDAATGALSGIPTAVGTYTFQVRASNGVEPDATGAEHSVTISPRLVAPAFTSDQPPRTANVASDYSYRFQASGYPAASYAIRTGALPDGLTLDATTGELAGYPTTTGTFTFRIAASNAVAPDAVSAEHVIIVEPELVAPSLTADSPPAAANVGSHYSYRFAATGYPSPTYAVTSGRLPDGLTLDSASGDLEGAPTKTGTFEFTITASNGVEPDAVGSPQTITVAPELTSPTFTSDSPPATARVGDLLLYRFAATGYPSPTFHLESGALPEGVTLDATTGELKGTVSGAGTYYFQVSATNGIGTAALSSMHTITVVASSPTPPPRDGLANTGSAPAAPVSAAALTTFAGAAILFLARARRRREG